MSVLVIGIVLVTLIGVWARPFAFPVDETRYLAVAWEMWWRDDFVLPWINGQPYDHKPPLLFWLIHAGWTVFGVNDWWPRWIGPLCILLAAVALAKLGRRVYPQVADAGAYAALLVFSTTYLAVYQTGIMFDALLLVAITTGWLGLHAAVTRGQWRDWGLFALGGALGMLTKGPVTLLYLLPALLAATLWRPSSAPPLHLSRAVVAVLAMVVPVLLWAFAAGMQGGEQYLRDLLIGQTAKRVQGAMGHPRPFYWYLPLLLLLSLPWAAVVAALEGRLVELETLDARPSGNALVAGAPRTAGADAGLREAGALPDSHHGCAGIATRCGPAAKRRSRQPLACHSDGRDERCAVPRVDFVVASLLAAGESANHRAICRCGSGDSDGHRHVVVGVGASQSRSDPFRLAACHCIGCALGRRYVDYSARL
ncbi:MAG: glycosyltransferase family 39 protein [Xanthomonadales bacterium]|nr:glycosyltransferase family 39 protein [Xanthomonadales bacterium]